MSITTEQLAEWRALYSNASPGAWSAHADVGCEGLFAVSSSLSPGSDIASFCTEQDAKFIAASYVAVPALIAEVERLAKERDEWRQNSEKIGRDTCLYIHRAMDAEAKSADLRARLEKLYFAADAVPQVYSSRALDRAIKNARASLEDAK